MTLSAALDLPLSLVPALFRRPEVARVQIARLLGGHDRPLRFADDLIAVPLSSMWDGPDDKVVLQASSELVELLPTYDPSVFSRNVGTVARSATEHYLLMTQLRVARLLDALRLLDVNGGHVLEVGCLFGSFALPLRRLGYSVTVVDRYAEYGSSFDAYMELMRREGIEVISVTRENEAERITALPRYDVVLAMAVIEHIPHTPRLFLESLRDHTRPGGVLALDTPNVARYWNRRAMAEGRSPHQDIRIQYPCAVPYEGHHREYTAQEMEWMLGQVGVQAPVTLLHDYNMLQFEKIDRPHIECLTAIATDLGQADTICVAGRLRG